MSKALVPTKVAGLRGWVKRVLVRLLLFVDRLLLLGEVRDSPVARASLRVEQGGMVRRNLARMLTFIGITGNVLHIMLV